MNRPLSEGFCLKEQLREIWMQSGRKEAEPVLLDWPSQARESKVPQMMKTAHAVLCTLFGRYIMPLTFCRNRCIIRRKHSRLPSRRLENTSVALISDMLTH